MDRDTIIRTIAAVVLSVLVLVGWMYFFPAPKPPQPRPTISKPAELPASGPETPAAPVTSPSEAVPQAVPPEAVLGDPSFPVVEIKTRKAKVTLSTRGGRVMTWELMDHWRVPGNTKQGLVDLVSPESRALDRHPLVIDPGDDTLYKVINESPFAVDQNPPSPEELKRHSLPAGTKRLALKWSDGRGLAVEKVLFLPDDDSYTAVLEWSATQNGQPLRNASIAWGPSIERLLEGKADNSYHYRGVAVAGFADGPRRFKPDKVQSDLFWPEGMGPGWVALDEQHFAVAFIPQRAASSGLRIFMDPSAPPATARQLGMVTSAPVVRIFAGPKADKLLQQVGRNWGVDLSGLVNWGFFKFLARPLYLVLAFFQGVLANWGLAIVLITAIIKLIFFPMTQKSMVKMRQTQEKMAKVQPKVHKLREKFKDKRDLESRKQMNEEMMALYQREGINPMSTLTGCLPMLLQLPVLYAMYTVLTVSIELRGAPFFGWIVDLSQKDPYYITPVVMGVTMLAQQIMSMTKTEDPQQKSQQRIMLIMPVMFTWFFLNLPSGLVLYWLVNNILSIAQQVLINRQAKAATA